MNFIVALAPRENFVGAFGDDFVDVHIGWSRAAALKNIDREISAHLARNNFISRRADCIANFFVEVSDFKIRKSRRLFDLSNRFDKFGQVVASRAAYRKIIPRPFSLNAVINIFANFHFAETIFFFKHVVPHIIALANIMPTPTLTIQVIKPGIWKLWLKTNLPICVVPVLSKAIPARTVA